MHARRLALALLALAAIVLGLFLWNGSRGGRDGAGGTPQGGEQREAADPAAELARPEPPGDLAPEDGPDGAAGTPAGASAEAREGQGGSPGPAARTVSGRVVLPADTPADEDLHVVALAEAASYAAFFAEAGRCEAPWIDEEARSGDVLATAAVATDGTFTLPLPPEADDAHLAVAGRYLFSRGTTRVPAGGSAVLPAQLGAWLTGRLAPPVEESGEGELEGAAVELGTDLGAGIDTTKLASSGGARRATTGADGRFELRAVRTGARLMLLAKPERFAVHVTGGLQLAPGEHRTLDVALSRGASLRGRVEDSEGRPLEGAEVEARLGGWIGQAADEVRKAETDAQGRFELAHVPAQQRLELRASREGFRERRTGLEEVLAEGEVREGLVLVLEEGLAITGTVAWPDGSPAQGAAVQAMMSGGEDGRFDPLQLSRMQIEETTADAEGAFAVHGLRPGRFRVEATRQGEGERTGAWGATVEDVAPGGEPLALVLEPLPAIQGRVVEEDGTSIESFRVRAVLSGSGSILGLGSEREEWSFAAAEDGRFRAEGLRPGVWKVVARAAGHASSAEREVVVPQAEGEVVELVLGPGCTVRGVVLDPGGRPRPGARVTVDPSSGSPLEALERGQAPEAHSDQEGRFELVDLDPGAWGLIAFVEGAASNEPVICDLGPGEVLDDVVLQLRAGGTLTGEVLNDEGEPDAGKMVTVQQTPTYRAQRLLITDEEGAFRVEHLEPGRWQVVVTPDILSGFGSGEELEMTDFLGGLRMEMVEIFDGEETHVVLGQPPVDPVTVRGRVLHAGEGVADAAVSFVPEERRAMPGLVIAVTDATGAFEADLTGSGPYLITVQRTRSMEEQVSVEYLEEIPATEGPYELVIDLPRGRISGRVLGPDDEPLAGCRVSLAAGDFGFGGILGGHYQETTTEEDGSYQLFFLRPGSYVVSAGGALGGGFLGMTSVAGRVVRDGVSVGEGESVEGVDFRLTAPGDLSGYVLDLGGAPAPGAAVFVRDEGGHLLESFSMIESDGAGKFLYRGLAPGRYSVSARSADRASLESALVDVASGETAEVILSLASASLVRISVVDDEDRPVRASVSVTDAEGREVGAVRSMSQIVETMSTGLSFLECPVGPLPPGQYTVVARSKDGREAKKPLTLSGQGERKLKLRVR